MSASTLLLCKQILTHPIYPQCMWFQRQLMVFKRFQALSSFRLVPSIEWRGSPTSNVNHDSGSTVSSCPLFSLMAPILLWKCVFLYGQAASILPFKTVSPTRKPTYIVCSLFSSELITILTDLLVFGKSELMEHRAIAQHLLLFSWKCIQISWAFLLQENNAILGYSIFC